MYVSDQLIEFSEFVLIGILISIIFDFFRAYRKIKKVSFIIVAIQDIIYFFIITIIFILSIVFLLNTNIRLYIFMAVFAGIMLYVTCISKYIIKFYMFIFKLTKGILKFTILPISLNIQIIIKIYNFFEKNIKKCCKMFFNMILNICSILKKAFLSLFNKKNNNKRGLKV